VLWCCLRKLHIAFLSWQKTCATYACAVGIISELSGAHKRQMLRTSFPIIRIFSKFIRPSTFVSLPGKRTKNRHHCATQTRRKRSARQNKSWKASYPDEGRWGPSWQRECKARPVAGTCTRSAGSDTWTCFATGPSRPAGLRTVGRFSPEPFPKFASFGSQLDNPSRCTGRKTAVIVRPETKKAFARKVVSSGNLICSNYGEE